ncbi:uncharacterized protein PADG_00138 [Paracoccidioides brasiliensis Pb18]|uniref:Uncharacterized protein n=1 Tax=Paracoccidioides brasiliensis (strain Pb18) TaxID=502780 RepID=C1FZU8_PARBD|nr:uncharacterized protein PADG_00138 [Paracoccidioides brasiliensis Pb18]EEH43849.2 hypothetical protein PADG_00138 [Paracoccidioides brasiliensis Pb18]
MDPSAHDKRGVIIHARARIQRFPRIPARGDIAIHQLVLGGLSPETSCLWATMSDGFAATNMPIDRRVMTKESTYVRLEQTSLIRNISGLNLMMTAHGREGMQFRDPRDHGEIIQKAKLLDNCSELDFDGSKKERKDQNELMPFGRLTFTNAVLKVSGLTTRMMRDFDTPQALSQACKRILNYSDSG